MPWHIARSDSCPDSKPFAVIKDDDGEVEGCHANEEAAKQQLAALYAQDSMNPTGKNMQHKAFDIIETKADADAGTFEATVAVFNNVDRGGDRILPGAFTKTLAEWEASGDPIPVILSHQWDNPMAHIGIAYAKDIAQTEKGLLVKGTLDVSDNDVARQVHRLMSRRSLKEFSFGYAVPKGGEKKAKDGANELSDLELFEVGPTLKGMNPATELHAVKSALDVEEPPVPDPQTLRKQSEQIKRDLIERDLPEIEPEPVVEEDPPAVAELKATVATLEKQLAELTAQPEKSQEELRRESEQIQRDLIKKDLPAPAEPERQPDPVQELSARVDTLAQGVEKALAELDERKKAEEADKEPKARSVDPLRRSSQEAVLRAQLDGLSLPKPPTKRDEPEPEQLDLKALRRQSRDVMLELLTGAIHDKE